MMHTPDREKVIKTFTDLAKISSPSWKEHRVMSYIIKRMKRLGATIEKYPCNGSYNLLARVEGTGRGRPVLLSSHMDTVVPCEKVTPVITDKKITSDGTTILGSDDKAAITMFIEALEILKKKKLPHPPLELLFSCAEELGLMGIKQFDMSVLESRTGFVFDSGGSVGKVILKAPWHSSMELFVKGKAAHAGMEPEKGVSAITVLSEIITAIPSGRIDEETTSNIGIISGGSATNIVSPESCCRLEVRSIDKKKLKATETEIRETAKSIAKKRGARVTIKRELEYPGFIIRETDRIVKITTDALKSIGITPSLEISGGGSDTNIFNRSGIRAINLSCGMQKVHTTEEFITIKDLIKGTELVLALLERA